MSSDSLRLAWPRLKSTTDRAHGFEHALRLGPFFETHISDLPSSSPQSAAEAAGYRIRDASVDDAERVARFESQAAQKSMLRMGTVAGRQNQQFEWELGHRPGPLANEPPDTYAVQPALALERKGKTVAVVTYVIKAVVGVPVEKRITVWRCWYEHDEDLPALAKVLAPAAFAHAQRLCEDRRREGDEDPEPSAQFQKLRWVTSVEQPLLKAMAAQGLVRQPARGPFYAMDSDQWVPFRC